jgi:hypothetical protein
MSSARFSFCSFLGNVAPRGAAAYSDSTNAVFTNCTVTDNMADPGRGIVEFEAVSIAGSDGFARNIVARNAGTGLVIGRAGATSLDRVRSNLFWENAPADTMLPGPLTAGGNDANRFEDPRFCNPDAGDFSVYYRSPAVRAACARPTFNETIGRFPVGCTDPGHSFLVRANNAAALYPYACRETASALVGAAVSRSAGGDTVRVAGSPGNGTNYRENVTMNARIALLGGWNDAFTAMNPPTTVSRFVPADSGRALLTVESTKDFTGAVIESLVIDTTAVVEGFTFENGFGRLGNGGGVFCLDASPRIVNNRFIENTTFNFGGGLCAIRSKNQPIRRNLFVENRAAHGGGIYLGECESPRVEQNLLFSNRTDLRGAGIRLAQHSGTALVHDNTVASNNGEGISFAGGGSGSEMFNNIIAFNTRSGLQQFPATGAGTVPVAHHNLLWANRGGNYEATSAGAGDVTLDPLFCRREARSYGLQQCSPAIGAGADSADAVLGHLRGDTTYALGDSAFCRDLRPPAATIRFLKNSIAPRFLDVYVAFSERVVDSTLVVETICENRTAEPLGVAPADSSNTLFGATRFETSDCGRLAVRVAAVDACGNDSLYARSVSTVVVAPGDSAALEDEKAGVRVEIERILSAKDVMLLIASDPGELDGEPLAAALSALGTAASEPFEVGGLSEAGASGALLRVRLPEGTSRERAGAFALYAREGSGWIRVETWVDPSGGWIVARPGEDGVYQLVLTEDAAASAVLSATTTLYQNAPNPARGTTSIAFDLPARSSATLRVFDASGRRVATLVDRELAPGRHAFSWTGVDHSGRSVPSGVYFYELRAGGQTEVRKLVLVR